MDSPQKYNQNYYKIPKSDTGAQETREYMYKSPYRNYSAFNPASTEASSPSVHSPQIYDMNVKANTRINTNNYPSRKQQQENWKSESSEARWWFCLCLCEMLEHSSC